MSRDGILRCIAGHGIPGSLGCWPEAPLPAAEWRAIVGAVRRERLSGLLMEALTSGALPATDEQVDDASALHLEQVCHVLLLESATLPVLRALDQADVETKVLKGSAVAHLDYPDPAQRLFVDIDLLVRARDMERAVHVMTDLGHTRHSIEPRRGFDRRFGKGATFTSSTGQEVDLHRTFVMGPFGVRLQLDDLWERSTPFLLAGRTVQALDAECRFLHACYHAALGDAVARLVPQRDVAQMLLLGDLDLDRVRRLMHAWQAEPVVARAVRMTWASLRIADVTAMSTWAQRYVTSARSAKDVAVYVDVRGRSYTAKSVATVAALPTLRDRSALTLALALPRRGFAPRGARQVTRRWRRALDEAYDLLRRRRSS